MINKLQKSVLHAKASIFNQKPRNLILVSGLLFVAIGLIGFGIWNNRPTTYDLSPAATTLLPSPIDNLGKVLKSSDETDSFEFNKDYKPATEVTGLISAPRFSASFSKQPKDGLSIVDPSTNIKFGMKPKYQTQKPVQDQNRLIYPIPGGNIQTVYTMQPARVKEDIIVNSFESDEMSFSYELILAEGTEARMESNGSVGIYGVDQSLLGDVITGSDADKKLLEKARGNGEKNLLLFTLPAPFVKEFDRQDSVARAWFTLDKNTLTLHANNLKNAKYPLSIDPSVYIDTATKLMSGNNESNIDFDVANELIEKGKTTGGRFDSWISTASATPNLQLASGRWNHATATYGGNVYVMGGRESSGAKGNLLWAKIGTENGDIQSAVPDGASGVCSGWCTNSLYDLPGGEVRSGASLVAYNGYLFLIGGLNSSNTTTNTVFIAKLGANGEPQLWHPTDSNKSNWTYWYSDTAISSARAYTGAVAYNNRLYLIGGTTNGATGGVATVEKADIAPNGRLTNWGSATALGNTRFGAGVQVYNDRLYVIGGASGTTPQNTVYFTKINNDGSLNNWQTGTPIGNGTSGGRASMGGNFTTVWGGYMYAAGGCTAMASTGHCSSVSNDIQIASINADGSITDWTTILGITNPRISYGLTAWRNRIYAIGGCTATQTTLNNCSSISSVVDRGDINPDGDVSTVSTSVAANSAPCSTLGYDCDMPLDGDNQNKGGRMSGATVINNGYIYYFGGCTTTGNGSVCFSGGGAGKATTRASYAQIDSVGNIIRVPTCPGNLWAGSWCVKVNGLPTANAAFGYTVFNNTLYVIGGTTGSPGWLSNISRSTFNADGTWGAWTTQTFASVGAGDPRGYLYSFTRANPNSDNSVGNLYLIGGCSGTLAGLDCATNIYSDVYKCNILSDGSIDTTNQCSTAGQVQIDSEPNTPGMQGLGVMAGTSYANYIYLIGGQSINQPERGSVLYAKIDDNNNIVSVNGSGGWVMSPSNLEPVRRRGVAFGYNGYLYALAGYNVSEGGSLNDLLYAKINVSDGSIEPFRTSSVTVSPRWDLRAAVNNGYVYAMGGCSIGAPPASCTTMTGTVQTFQLYNNYSGSPKQYTASSQFSTNRYGAGTAVLDGYIYTAGGCTSPTDCTSTTNSVQYAPLNQDGTIGSWSAAANLPTSTGWGKLLAAGNTLYYIGGQLAGSSAGTTGVYYATINNGNITGWTATTGLPEGRSQFGAAVWNNRLYIVGGNNPSGAVTNTIYVSSQQNSGGAIVSWSTASPTLNVARSGPAVIAYANNLYVYGGFDGTRYLNDSQYSQINSSTGQTDTWGFTTSLPTTLRQADGFAANGFMYLFGGRTDNTTCRSNTIVAPISANTTIASGNKPTGIGDWYATNVRYSGNRYGAGAVYYDGKAYVLGGQCANVITTGTNQVQVSTLQSQPQLARYSRLIDTDTDVFPKQWLMNGLDNSIGARWYLRYRSMTNPLATTPCTSPAMTTWGKETNYGEITLGAPGPYYPLNSAGSNTGCARYYYLSVNIDSSQAYGYPEDVSRGPTINDLSLFFTADPSKRLMHGRTFTGGLQQPLDTPAYAQ